MESLEKSLQLVKKAKQNQYHAIFEFSKNWVKNKKDPFTSEDLIQDYKCSEFPKPLEYRVFGAVIGELRKQEIILHHGFTTYRNPKGHKKPVNVWIAKQSFFQKLKNFVT